MRGPFVPLVCILILNAFDCERLRNVRKLRTYSKTADCKRFEILTTSRSEIYSATFTYGTEQCYLKKRRFHDAVSQNLVGDGSVTYTDASDEVPGRRSVYPEKELRERRSVTKYRWYLVKTSGVGSENRRHRPHEVTQFRLELLVLSAGSGGQQMDVAERRMGLN
jgi:hypothetical protein